MTKTEMLDKLNRIVRAVEALPDGARPLAVSVSDPAEYIHLSSNGETPEATNVVRVVGESGPYKEYRAEVLGAPVIWLEI